MTQSRQSTRTAHENEDHKSAPPVSPTPLAAELISGFGGDPNFMSSLARGLAVIRAFGQERRRMTMAEVSIRTGIPRAAVRRCLYSLEKLGYVTSENRLFALTPQMLLLGHAYLSSTPLVVSAQSYLDRLSTTLHESASLSVLDGDEILYLARSATSRIMRVSLHVGSRLPAYCTSMGQVLLASLSQAGLDAYLTRVRLTRYTDSTLTSRARLARRLREVRDEGFAIVDQELEGDLRSVAVPIRDRHGAVVAAINASTQASRVEMTELRSRFVPALTAAARELSIVLRG